MKNRIIELAKRLDADIVGFAPASRFEKDDAIFKIFPNVKTVIGLAFRVLRGAYRCVEEGTTYYQYTTMGVENLEETVMPQSLVCISNLIEEEGYEAIPQRKNPFIMKDKEKTDPEVDYRDIRHGIEAENQMDFLDAAVMCGLGERSMINSLLTKEFGPFVRYCFILTDAEIEPTPLCLPSLCDKCGECIKACHGKAISDNGSIDTWRCAVYYNGANGSKNPFLPPDAYLGFENRLDIINGTAEFDTDGAKDILDNTYFYPPVKNLYSGSMCGRACDRACYIHLERKGVLTRKFNKQFREKEDWKLSTKQFETLRPEKVWEFTKG